ncbi:AMP-dependent synthetase [Spongiactinospora gelatinilytica]|uniref:AMP-dependent synthetase n=1 Tax=Spongiactinospora gelatinilytica TaxID=2666298 RepID=A0A2W2J1S6_9ACTN|nr:AMP-binding protein [Spongiactinospora gelatinilytica]PZG55544.1 AMP-dependent synthetase [Spongiactinospora gelatinilytica]
MPGSADSFRAARDALLRFSHDRAAAAREFRWPEFGPVFNWATDWFDEIARGNPATALWIVAEDGTETRLSFDELARRSDQVATWLSDAGVRQGDPVIVMLGNQVELWETTLAVMKLGGIVMPTATAAGPADLADRVARGGARFVIARAADTATFERVPGEYTRILTGEKDAPGWLPYREAYTVSPRRCTARTAPGDPLLYYFTSGTTSRPKLVVHTQVSYPVGHLTTMYWLGVRPGDVHLNISSPGWAKHAYSCLFGPWNAEATVFVADHARFDAAALLDRIRAAGVTTFCAPPTVWRMLVQTDLSGGPGALREVTAAGEPLNAEVIAQIERAWGLTVRDGYGQTETTLLVGNSPGVPVRPGSMGLPMPGVGVELIDAATGLPGDEGEVCLDLAAGPRNLMAAYLADEGPVTPGASDGRYHTGDIAVRDVDGYITFLGRADDMFKASDYRISPFELESALIEHPAVAEAAVVPAPDAIRLAVPKAYITPAAGWEPGRDTALAIFRHARERLAPYQRIRRLEFGDLPKTTSGKIRRVELRAREQGAAVAPGAHEWRDDEFPELRAAGG